LLEGCAAVSQHLRGGVQAADCAQRMSAMVMATVIGESGLVRPCAMMSLSSTPPNSIAFFSLHRGSIARIDLCTPASPRTA
jgi:hypothetical protein